MHLLYIDPGTGSMLFTILLGLIGAAFYSIRLLFVKLHFVITGGKKVEMNKNKIPFVIFSDSKRYWNIFEPICKEMDQRGMDVVYMTASPDDPALQCTYPHVKAQFIGEGNKAFAKLNFLNASIVLSTTPGLDVYQWKRSKDVQYYVHIPHMASDISLYHMFGIDYYDAVLYGGEFQLKQVREMETSRGLLAKEMVPVGIPYMDVMKRRLDEAGPLPAHETTILLAPSWGPTAILSKYGEKMIQSLLDTGYHVVVRPHPQSFTSEKEMLDRLMKKYPDNEKIEWNRDNDNFEVLRRSDLMISDFSGVIFDFTLIYDKPVIYTAAKIDTAADDAAWSDSPLWTTEILPKLGIQLDQDNFGNLKELIDSCRKDNRFAEGRNEAKKEAWPYIGEGASHVADYLIAKEKELSSSETAK